MLENPPEVAAGSDADVKVRGFVSGQVSLSPWPAVRRWTSQDEEAFSRELKRQTPALGLIEKVVIDRVVRGNGVLIFHVQAETKGETRERSVQRVGTALSLMAGFSAGTTNLEVVGTLQFRKESFSEAVSTFAGSIAASTPIGEQIVIGEWRGVPGCPPVATPGLPVVRCGRAAVFGLSLASPRLPLRPAHSTTPWCWAETDNVVMAGYGIDCNSFDGIDFVPDSTSGNSFTVPPAIDVDCDGSSFAFVFYGETNLFVDPALAEEESRGATVASKIIHVDPTGAPTENLDPPVRYVLEVSELDGSMEAECVYWDYQANNGAGGWKGDGCTLVKTGTGTGASTSVTCECTHMTNFAVLTRVKPVGNTTNATGDADEAHELALSIITYVGVFISVPALLLLVLVFALSPSLHNTNRFITGNLAFSLGVSLLIFVFGIDAVTAGAGCTAIAAILHYALLCAFMWMLVDGWFLFRTFCRIFEHHAARDSWVRLAVIAYGVPAGIVVICLGAALDQYGTEENCWLSPDGLIYAFIAPIAAVILVNLYFFFRVIRVVVHVSGGSELQSDATDRRRLRKAKRSLRASATFLPVLGASWVFGLFAISPGSSIVWVYLFSIATGLQGFLIFVFHFLTDKQVMAVFMKGIGLGRWYSRRTDTTVSTFSTSSEYHSAYHAKRADTESTLYMSTYSHVPQSRAQGSQRPTPARLKSSFEVASLSSPSTNQWSQHEARGRRATLFEPPVSLPIEATQETALATRVASEPLPIAPVVYGSPAANPPSGGAQYDTLEEQHANSSAPVAYEAPGSSATVPQPEASSGYAQPQDQRRAPAAGSAPDYLSVQDSAMAASLSAGVARTIEQDSQGLMKGHTRNPLYDGALVDSLGSAGSSEALLSNDATAPQLLGPSYEDIDHSGMPGGAPGAALQRQLDQALGLEPAVMFGLAGAASGGAAGDPPSLAEAHSLMHQDDVRSWQP